MQIEGLYIKKAGSKGRGVFTKHTIPAKTIIEKSPVIVLSPKDRKKVEETELSNYIFEWGEKTDHAALALGWVSIYNHASPSNCEYIMNYKNKTITIQTMKDILPDEELTINYSAGWDEWKPVWFKTDS
jgi:SET domain-containing protein